MKKLWAGILILAILLGVGILTSAVMQHNHRALSRDLKQAAVLAHIDWHRAKKLADAARAAWENQHYWVASLVDHEPLEEINSLFDQLALCIRDRDLEDFAAVCARIASIADMLEEANVPYWWNLL